MNIEQPKIDEDLDFTTTETENVSNEDTIEGCNNILLSLYKKLDELKIDQKNPENSNLIIDVTNEIDRLEEKRRLIKSEKYDLSDEARKAKEEADAELFEKTLVRDGTRNKF